MSNRIGAFAPTTERSTAGSAGGSTTTLVVDLLRSTEPSGFRSKTHSKMQPLLPRVTGSVLAPIPSARMHNERRSRRSMLPAKDRLSGFGGRQAGVEIAV